MATYTVPSGDRIWAGRDVVMPDPDDVSFTWPPGANCSIPTAEGVNAPIHPKVLDFGVSGWNGYRYWMAYTPYPIGNDDLLENPCIVASNDGDTWVAPSTNPIVPAPDGAQVLVKYNSDTHLCFLNGTMYLVWRPVDSSIPLANGREKIKYCTSTDGENWSAETTILSTTVDLSVILSPTLEYFDGQWWLWTYRRNVTPIVCDLRKASSLAGLQSATPTTCTLSVPDATHEPWHFDVVRIPNGWAMLISDRNRSTKSSGRLLLALSADGITWDVKGSVFATSSPNTYRSSIVKKADNSGFDCWVTDWDARKIRRLSLTLGV